MKKRITLALMMFCIIGFAFAGGTSEASSSSEGKKFSGVTIEYASCYSAGEAVAEWLTEQAEMWEEETGGKVQLNFVGRDVLTQIRPRILSGNVPDLVDQDLSELQAALLTNDVLVEPIDDVYASTAYGEDVPLKDVINGGYKLYETDGHDYFLPFIFVTAGFFYDKAMFAEYGLEVPATWEDLLEVCEVLKSNGIDPIALDGNISFYNAYYYKWALQRIAGSGNLIKAATDKTGAAWDDPAYLEAAELVYTLSKSGKNYFAEGYEGSVWPAGQSEWALGNAGLVFCGTWIPLETRTQIADTFQYGFFPFPAVEGGKDSGDDLEVQLIGPAILKGAKNVEAAKDFMRFISTKSAHDSLVELSDNMAARTDAIYPEVLADVRIYVDSANNYHPNYDGAMGAAPEWWANVFYPADNALVFGEVTPEEFISNIKAETINFYRNK